VKFKFLGRLRGDDDEDDQQQRQSGGPRDAPIDRVQQLSDQGYSEEEIRDQLRDQGYTHSEITQAINDAVRASASQMSDRPRGQQPGPGGGGYDEYDEGGYQGGGYDDEFGQFEEGPPMDQGGGMQGASQPSGNDFQQQPQQPASPEPQQFDEPAEEPEEHAGGITPEEEELIEVIVAEHFTEVEEEFDSVYAELDDLQDQIDEIQEQIEELEIRKEERQTEFMQKVNEMQDYFEQSNQRIGGMEKAFQQVLPSLVENVRELSSLVKEMKDEESA